MQLLGDPGLDLGDIRLRVQPLDGGKLGQRRFLALQTREVLGGQGAFDGAQPGGLLGMAETRVMREAGRVGEKQRCHAILGVSGPHDTSLGPSGQRGLST